MAELLKDIIVVAVEDDPDAGLLSDCFVMLVMLLGRSR
jgi:hypothetical protein